MGKPRRAPRHLGGGAQGEGEAKLVHGGLTDQILSAAFTVHTALGPGLLELLTYLRLTHLTVGLLLNFNVTALKHGIVRRVL